MKSENSMTGGNLGSGKGSAKYTVERWNEIRQRLHLTLRQTQVIQGMLDDDTEYAIATNLLLSPHTVHGHIQAVYKKLHVHTRLSLSELISETDRGLDTAKARAAAVLESRQNAAVPAIPQG